MAKRAATAPLPASRPLIITIDGPAASGKGTLARRLATHFGLDHLDTGLLYRAVGLKAARAAVGADDVAALVAMARALKPSDLHDPDLRGDDAAAAASRIATIPEVRRELVVFQRAFATNPPGGRGAVLDGRDTGTVICPDAPYKLFLLASETMRAQRRLKELRERNIPSIQAEVLREMKARDERDSQREVAPMVPAKDAFPLDTSELNADAAFAAALTIIASKDRGEAP